MVPGTRGGPPLLGAATGAEVARLSQQAVDAAAALRHGTGGRRSTTIYLAALHIAGIFLWSAR
ncbi:hypothetical protein [Streptomyces sp. TRM68367]|uniref:hypothetical protein n=1 Tax=Streptomyces sp. TRM68367 TaxID=2758415 RepID=UPI00165A87D3|nr:hypothetical protein [Streptomyces sp. TRM68367]MBC9725489.1 hypothetical protein [Streptomyces sp. TRM68367]